jgi:hypothetical protein
MAVVKMACGAASCVARESLDLNDEPGSALRKSGVGPGFRLRLRGFRRFVAWIKRSKIRERRSGSVAAPGFRSAQPGLRKKGRKRNAGKRRVTNRRILRCGARPFGARTLDGVPPRLSPKGIIPSQRLSFRPGFLGRGLHGRYPPSPVPVQGSTSHPGRNAGRHDTQAARKRTANPPAGTALAPMTRCASVSCPSLERDCSVTEVRTIVKRVSPKKIRRGRSDRRAAKSPLSGARQLPTLADPLGFLDYRRGASQPC